MKNIILTPILAAVLMISACNKTKVNTKRLSGEEWKVVNLTVGGVSTAELPEMEFSDCDPYEQACTGEWHLGAAHVEFAWGFSEKGSRFTISNQSDHTHSGSHEEEELLALSQDLSGTYDVKEDKRTKMKLISSSTIGYPGTEVVLEIEKK